MWSAGLSVRSGMLINDTIQQLVSDEWSVGDVVNSPTLQLPDSLTLQLLMRALLISTYDMGRQPFGLASPAAWLRRDGVDVRLVDVAKERLRSEDVATVDLVAFHLPMHTATRLAA